jgi:hypothetical protein
MGVRTYKLGLDPISISIFNYKSLRKMILKDFYNKISTQVIYFCKVTTHVHYTSYLYMHRYIAEVDNSDMFKN